MGASQDGESREELPQVQPLHPPSQRWKVVFVLAVVAMVLILGLFVVLDPDTSPFSSIRDTDGDGRPDSTDPYPDDPFDREIPMNFVSAATYGGFAGVCADSGITIDWEDVEVRLSSGTASASWSNLVQPTVTGPVGYMLLDCGPKELGTRSVELTAWNEGSEEGFGLGDYLNFRFDAPLYSGDTFSVVVIQESSGSSLAVFTYTVP